MQEGSTLNYHKQLVSQIIILSETVSYSNSAFWSSRFQGINDGLSKKSMLPISLYPNRYRVYQCPQAERAANGNQGICICPPRVLAFSHCIELGNEGRNSTQTAQESKFYARGYSITSLGIHLYQNKPRFCSSTLHVCIKNGH